MKKSKYLVVLKTPGTSFMVDGIVGKFPRSLKNMGFMQEGKMLYIPVHADSNIAYIMEMTKEDVDAFEESVLKARARILKPALTTFGKRTH